MKSALVFGAGNIGRSFIGKAFAKGGWKVIFVDVDLFLSMPSTNGSPTPWS